MSLVPAKCAQCGSNLEIDLTKDTAVCPFCNTPFINEKAINNYSTENITKSENINTEKVIFSESLSREEKLLSGQTFIKLGIR